MPVDDSTLIQAIARNLTEAQDALKSWTETFAQNPVTAFENASHVMQAAATREVAMRLQDIIADPKHGGVDVAKRAILQATLDGALHPASRDAGFASVMREALTQAYAKYVEMILDLRY